MSVADKFGRLAYNSMVFFFFGQPSLAICDHAVIIEVADRYWRYFKAPFFFPVRCSQGSMDLRDRDIDFFFTIGMVTRDMDLLMPATVLVTLTPCLGGTIYF
jgi:hypothetical protein